MGGPLRVCHVVHELGPGGAEQVLLELATAAPAVGLELSVLSLMPTEGRLYPPRLRALGIPVASLGLPSRWDPSALPRGLVALRTLGPQVVHTHLKHADLVGAYAARRLGVPLVSSLHLVEDIPGRIGWAKRWAAAQARLRRADLTVAVSDALRDWYLRTFRADPTRVVTIRNGVAGVPPLSEDARLELRARLGVPAGSVLATMVGVMRPGKGHADMVTAARRLPRHVHVLLVGDGELRPELEEAARSLPAGRLGFAGYRNDVPALLAASDLVVHPSHFDALPTALIQALAAGRPVVAAAVGGIPEIVTPGTGALVAPGDTDALAAAVSRLAGDSQARRTMGEAARLRFEEEFEVTRWAGRLRSAYDGVLAGRR